MIIQVIPTDSTGQLDILEEYIEDRIDIFKWIALAIMIIQVSLTTYAKMHFKSCFARLLLVII
jgi:hypothetical protein